MKPVPIHLRDFLLIALVWAVLYVHGIGAMQLEHEEPRRALVAREMMATGQWLVPHLNGRPYLAKPPLFYWLIAASGYALGEVSETAARLPGVLSVLGIALLAYAFGSQYGNRPRGRLAALMAMSCGLFLEKGAVAEIDMNFALWVTASLFFLYRAGSGSGRAGDWPLAYGFLAAAFLTKGPPALIFFGVGLAAIVWLFRGAGGVRGLRHATGLLCFVVPVGLWVLAVHMEVGIGALVETSRSELVDRALGKALLNPLEWLYYPGAVIAGLLPWSLLGVGFFGAGALPSDVATRRQLGFCIAVVFLSAIAFSFSAGKAARYLIPLLPFGAVVLADVLARLFDGELPERVGRRARQALVGLSVLACAGMVALGIISVAEWEASWMSSFAFSGIGLIVCGVAVRGAFQRRYAVVFAGILAGVCVYRSAWVSGYVPDSNARKDVSAIVAPIREAVPERAEVYSTLRPPAYLLYYYIDRPVVRVDAVDELATPSEARRALLFKEQFERLNRLHPGMWVGVYEFAYRGETAMYAARAE